MNTNRWMQEVNARFPVRKSKAQKERFRQYFKLGVGICACRKKKHIGWYCSKIHTKHDTTYDEITLQGVADTVEAVLRQVVEKEQA